LPSVAYDSIDCGAQLERFDDQTESLSALMSVSVGRRYASPIGYANATKVWAAINLGSDAPSDLVNAFAAAVHASRVARKLDDSLQDRAPDQDKGADVRASANAGGFELRAQQDALYELDATTAALAEMGLIGSR
jgi:hypothetical protein